METRLRRPVPLKRFPWWLVSAAAPVVPLFKEMREMRYLWREPLRLDNAALLRALGTEPRTPLEEAVRATLAGLGCLPAISTGDLLSTCDRSAQKA